MQKYQTPAQKINFQDVRQGASNIAHGVVSSAGRLGRHLASPVGEFNASNVIGHSDTTRRNYAISIAETLAAGVLLTVAEIATGGLATFALGGAALAVIHANIAIANYKLSNINDLLGKKDIQTLKDLITENKKLQAELSKYKDTQARDIPPDLKKRSYTAIMRQYKTMKNLEAALAKAKTA